MSHRILEEPSSRNQDVQHNLQQRPTLSWLHSMRDDPDTQSYIKASEIATREALLPGTNLRTTNTLLSIAKLMSLQVVLEENLEEDVKEATEISYKMINAQLALVDLQQHHIYPHAILNQHEIGSKWRRGERLDLSETLECHFNRLRQLRERPESEWDARVLSLLAPEEKIARARHLIEDLWDELETAPEEMDSRRTGIEKTLRLPGSNLEMLLSELRDYFLYLTETARTTRSVGAVVSALRVVHHTRVSERLDDNQTDACYVAVWMECLRSDVETLVEIQGTDEVKESSRRDELTSSSIFANAVADWRSWLGEEQVGEQVSTVDLVERWALRTSILNQAYVELGKEMVMEFGSESGMLPTLQKVCSQWSE